MQTHTVAVVCDQLVREKWALPAHAAGLHGSFDINAAMEKLDERIYKQAFLAAKESEKPPTVKGAQPSAGLPQKELSKAFAGKCNYCDKWGHRKQDCFKLKADLKRSAEQRQGEAGIGVVYSGLPLQ